MTIFSPVCVRNEWTDYDWMKSPSHSLDEVWKQTDADCSQPRFSIPTEKLDAPKPCVATKRAKRMSLNRIGLEIDRVIPQEKCGFQTIS